MSKVKNSTVHIGWGEGYAISSDAPDRIVGRVMGIIEAVGMSEKQEESVKNLLRGAVWEVFGDGVYISSTRHTEIRNAYYEEHQKAQQSNSPALHAI